MNPALHRVFVFCASSLLVAAAAGAQEDPKQNQSEITLQLKPALPRAPQQAPESPHRALVMERRVASGEGFQFAWKPVPGAEEYQVQIAVKPTFEKESLILDQKTSQTQVSLPAEKYREAREHETRPSDRIFWRVRPAFRGARELHWGNWGPPWYQLGTTPGIPTNLYPDMATTETEAFGALCLPTALSWDPVTNATGYHVQVAEYDFSNPIVDIEVSRNEAGTGFLPGTGYTWRVRAKNGAVYGSWSETAEIWGTYGYPQRVTLINPPDTSPNAPSPITLDWEQDSQAHQYVVRVDDSGAFDSPEIDRLVSAPPLTTGDLADGTVFHWKVRARNPCADGQWSPVWTFTPYCPRVFPADLLHPADGAQIDLPVQLLWYGVTGAESYQVQVDDNQDFTSPEVDEERGWNFPNYSATGLAGNMTYYWRVRTGNGCAWSDWGAPWSFTTCQAAVDITPQSPQPHADVDIPVTLSWAANPTATSFHIQLSGNQDFSTTIVDTQTTENTLSTAGLSRSTTYHWRVRGHSGCEWGDWSDARSFTTCGQPIDVALLDPADGYEYGYPFTDPILSWEDAASAVSYEIEVSRQSDFSSVIRRLESVEPVATVTWLWRATTYYWRVRAFDGCAWGNWSSPRSFLTGYLEPKLVKPDDDSTGLEEPVLLRWDHPQNSPFLIEVYDNANPSEKLDSGYGLTCLLGTCKPSGYTGHEAVLSADFTQPGHTYTWRVALMYAELGCTYWVGQSCVDWGWEVKFYWSDSWSFQMFCPMAPAPVLILPPDQASSVGELVIFDWEDVPDGQEYQLQVDIDAAFSNPVIDQTRPVSDAFTTDLSIGTTYHWRARAYDDCGWGNWSDSWRFTP